MNIADRIEAADKELLAMKDNLVELTKALEAAPDEESILIQVEELSARVEKQSATVNALKKAETALAAKAAPVGAPAIIHQSSTKAADGGDLIWKMAAAKAIAYAEKKSVSEVISERYQGNNALEAVSDYVEKSAVAPANTYTAGWAQELVQTSYQGFLDTLKPVSVAAGLSSYATTLNFGGYDSITIPRLNNLAAQLTEPAWVGEGGEIPLTQFNFGSSKINRYKLAAITTMTKEITQRSTPAIEGILRGALTEAYGQVLDNALLSATGAVAGVRPAGLLNGVTPGTGTTGGGQAAVIADLKAMMTAMTAANMGAKPVLLMSTITKLSVSLMTTSLGQRVFADEVGAGRLLGMPIIASQHVPAGTVIMIDAGSLALGFDTPIFDVSDVATVVESNANATAPTMAGTDATPGAVGTAGQVPRDSGIKVSGSTGASTTGYTARSLWQSYSLGIRMVAPTSWATIRPGAVYATNTITW